ncbi:hypothetical protein TDB9533_01879 [Thalassocella blandensis]|nr:hypothetical protein TDB9533_01879 [Thalassocella blandensis]
MMNKSSLFLIIAAALGFLAVALGAFGAHGLKKVLSEPMLSTYHTAVEYQFYHVFALLGAALWLKFSSSPSGWLEAGAWLFIAGIVIFSGSLYVLALSGIRWLGMITPVGGVFFLLGWLALIVAAVKE